MGNTVSHSNGGIKIHMRHVSGDPPLINPEYVQNRLSEDEFKQFWDRLKQQVRCYYIFNYVLIAIMLLSIISFLVYRLTVRYFDMSALIAYVASIITAAILSIVNAVMIRKKYLAFVAKENSEYWAAKGLYWQFLGFGKNSYLELKIAPAAMSGYQPPVQYPQAYFQGGMPDNYSQQQGDYYSQQQGDYYAQTQPGNYKKAFPFNINPTS